MTKLCPRCEVQKDSDQFATDRSRSDGLSAYCKTCRSNAEKLRREKNPEEYYKYLKEYRESHPDKVEAWKLTQKSKPKLIRVPRDPKPTPTPEEVESKKEQNREKSRQYYRDHREERLKYAKRYAEENREDRSEYRRKYNHDNPDQAKQYRATTVRNRRARISGAGGSHTSSDVRRIFEEQHGMCKYCGVRLFEYHIDHIVPLSRGGSNGSDNIALACPSCNMSKSDKLWPEEWEVVYQILSRQ